MSDPGASRAGRGASLYLTAVIAAGLLAMAVGLAVSLPAEVDTPVVTVLVAAMIAGIWAPIRYQRKGGVVAFDVSDGVLIALLFAAPLGLVPGLAAVASVVGNATVTRDPRKLAFNASAHALKASGAAIVFWLLSPASEVLVPRTIAVIVVAVAVYALMDAVLYGTLFATLEQRRFLDVASDIVPLTAISAIGTVLVGIFLAFVLVADRVASVFAFVLVAVAHIGFRGYALAVEERRRNEHLRTVSRELADLAAPGAAAERYLRAVAGLFEADGVELVIHGGPRGQRLGLRRGEIVSLDVEKLTDGIAEEAIRRGGSIEVDASDDDMFSRKIRERGHEHAVAAPLIYDGNAIGAIVVYDAGGLTSGRTTDLLVPLANDAAIAAKTLELFEQVSRERTAITDETRKLQDIVEATSDGIALIDANGRVLTWNAAMTNIVGHEDDDVVGRHWYMALRLRDPNGEDISIAEGGPMHAALSGQRSATAVDLQVLRTDGDWRWVRCSISPVTRGDAVDGLVLVMHDVHRQRETEEMKADLVSTVSHELRTPLTPLKGLLLTMVNSGDKLTPEQQGHLNDSMLRQVERLENLVADLLIVGDIDRGRFVPRLEPCDLTLAVADVVATEPSPQDSERVIIQDQQSVHALADRRALTRIVRALVGNALKHTDGRVMLRSYIEGDRACFAVTDEGGGISDRDRERIFERFSRLGDHLTRSTQGTGLGLTVAKGLAEEMGGSLDVTSTPGKGSTFTLWLPVAPMGERPFRESSV